MQFLIATTIAVISLVGVVSPCPAPCSCSSGMVNCKDRRLSSIPKDIPYTTTDLDLSNNAISEIERGAFFNLPSLRSIDLSYNTISEIERGAFFKLSSLTSIDLSFNAISEIKRGSFSNLLALYKLDLSYNTISEIEMFAFYNLSSLRSISLKANKIARVEAWFLDGMPVINKLLMIYNNITFVSEKAFQYRTDLDIGLQMFCGCSDNYPLWKWLRETNKFQQIMGCYYPIGSYLEDLVPTNFHNCSVTTSRTTASPPNRTTATPSSRTTSTPASRTTATPSSRTTSTPSRRTTPTPARRTTATRSSRTTSTPTSRITMTTTSASRIIRKKLEATAFAPRAVIGIVIGAGSLATCLLLLGVIWRLRRQFKEKGDKIMYYSSNTTE